MIKETLLLGLLFNTALASAHCPASFRPENVCLMLDQNVIFIYDQKAEHNGPYKDLSASTITSVKAEQQSLKFSRVARGVFRIDSPKLLKKIEIEFLNVKKITSLTLMAD